MRRLIVLLILFTAFSIHAEEINIPANYPTIQAGINAANDGDTIYVAPDTYYESINFLGKSIFLSSYYDLFPDTSMIAETIITQHPDSIYSVVNFINGEDSSSVLYGFTITNAERGVLINNNSNPTIDHNIISENFNMQAMVGGYGGGIQIINSSPIIRYNIIENNKAVGALMDGAYGGGLAICVEENYAPHIYGNVIRNNYCSAHGSYGGGLYIAGAGSPIVENNQFYENTCTSRGGAICISAESSAIIRNNLIYHNASRSGDLETGPRSNLGGGIAVINNSLPLIEGNCIKENYGGGVFVQESNPILGTIQNPNSIYNNFINKGRDITLEDSPDLVIFVDTLTFSAPDERLLFPFESFTPVVNNGYFPNPVYTSDIYVNPEGNDQNSGLSENDPLRTINAATLRGPVESGEAVTIHLAPGIYDYNEANRNYPASLWHNYHILGEFPDNTIITGNDDLVSSMPLFYAVELDTFSIQNVTLKDAYTSVFASDTNFGINNCFILDFYEAAVYCYHSSMFLTDSYISNRSRVPYTRSFGGVFMMYYTPPEQNINISGNIFERNLGPAIWARNAETHIHNNIIRYNGAPGISLAGGIALREHSSTDIHNNLLYGNYTNDTGAAIQSPFWQTFVTLTNNTIVNNICYSTGSGGIYISGSEGSAGEFNNNIIYGNINLEGASQIVSESSDLSINYCDIEGGWEGISNFDTDPLFEDTLFYNLSAESPCIDNGSSSLEYNDPEDPDNSGSALWPALGTINNDCGTYGGPASSNLSPHWLEIISPNGAEQIQIGTDFTITWNTLISGNVNLAIVFEEGGVVPIADNVENNGSYIWQVGDGIYPGNYKIEIKAVNTPFVMDRSDRSFALDWEFGVEFSHSENILPKYYALEKIYPTPFNSQTFIRIALPQSSNLTVTAYNILGEEVQTLASNYYSAGWHNIPFNGQNLASGTYIIKASVNDKLNQTQKVVLIK